MKHIAHKEEFWEVEGAAAASGVGVNVISNNSDKYQVIMSALYTCMNMIDDVTVHTAVNEPMIGSDI